MRSTRFLAAWLMVVCPWPLLAQEESDGAANLRKSKPIESECVDANGEPPVKTNADNSNGDKAKGDKAKGDKAKGDKAKRDKAKGDKAQQLFDGKTLKGWTTPDKHMFDKHGKVEVRKGELHLAMGKPASGVTWSKPFPKNNYELTLEAKRTDGGDFFCGLTFPVDKEFCSLIVGGWGGGVIGLSNVDANSAVENETTGYRDFKNNQWYKIRLRVSDERIEAWIDKEQVVNLERKGHKFEIWWEQEPLRPLGIATWNTAAALRNIQVRTLTPKKAKPPSKKNTGKSAPDKNKPRG